MLAKSFEGWWWWWLLLLLIFLNFHLYEDIIVRIFILEPSSLTLLLIFLKLFTIIQLILWVLWFSQTFFLTGNILVTSIHFRKLNYISLSLEVSAFFCSPAQVEKSYLHLFSNDIFDEWQFKGLKFPNVDSQVSLISRVA